MSNDILNLNLDSLHTIKKESYVGVEESVNPQSVMIPEERFQDVVFRNYNSFTNATVKKDNTHELSHFQNPLHTQYVIKNFKEDVFVMYPNNIVLLPFTDPFILEDYGNATQSFYENSKELSLEVDFTSSIRKYFKIEPKDKVILIIDYLTIDRNSKESFNKLFNYYNESAYDRFFYRSNNVTMGMRSNMNFNFAKYVFERVRVVTLIRYEELEQAKHHMLNVSKCGITLSLHNAPGIGIESPLSKEYKNFVKQQDTAQIENGFKITIVDNYTNKDYYMKMGNEVIKLDVTNGKRNNLEQGIYFQYIKNSVPIMEKRIPLKECSSLGIFNSKDEALAYGDLKSQVEIEKIQCERETAQLKLSAAQLDVDKRKLDHALTEKAAETNLNIALAKAEVDFAATAAKTEIDAAGYNSKLSAYTGAQLAKVTVDTEATLSKTVVANEATVKQIEEKLQEDNKPNFNNVTDKMLKVMMVLDKSIGLAAKI